jgi:hypothetical protein
VYAWAAGSGSVRGAPAAMVYTYRYVIQSESAWKKRNTAHPIAYLQGSKLHLWHAYSWNTRSPLMLTNHAAIRGPVERRLCWQVGTRNKSPR